MFNFIIFKLSFFELLSGWNLNDRLPVWVLYSEVVGWEINNLISKFQFQLEYISSWGRAIRFWIDWLGRLWPFGKRVHGRLRISLDIAARLQSWYIGVLRKTSDAYCYVSLLDFYLWDELLICFQLQLYNQWTFGPEKLYIYNVDYKSSSLRKSIIEISFNTFSIIN